MEHKKIRESHANSKKVQRSLALIGPYRRERTARSFPQVTLDACRFFLLLAVVSEWRRWAWQPALLPAESRWEAGPGGCLMCGVPVSRLSSALPFSAPNELPYCLDDTWLQHL